MELKESDKLKNRVQALKPFPSSWAKKFVTAYPEYNNIEGVDKVRNVGMARIADKEITEKMESLWAKPKRRKSQNV